MAITIDVSHKAQHQIVEANALQEGDVIVNVGLVRRVRRDGVFVTAAVSGTEWSLATGTGDTVNDDITWHETNEILIDRLQAERQAELNAQVAEEVRRLNS